MDSHRLNKQKNQVSEWFDGFFYGYVTASVLAIIFFHMSPKK
jgi:hypothetical protein